MLVNMRLYTEYADVSMYIEKVYTTQTSCTLSSTPKATVLIWTSSNAACFQQDGLSGQNRTFFPDPKICAKINLHDELQ